MYPPVVAVVVALPTSYLLLWDTTPRPCVSPTRVRAVCNRHALGMRSSAFYAIEPNKPHAQLAAQGYPRTARRTVVRDGVDEGHGDAAPVDGHLDELE